MTNKWNIILNIMSGLCIGAFLVYVIYMFWDYSAHPNLYIVQSAPWYTGIFVYGILTIIVLGIIFFY